LVSRKECGRLPAHRRTVEGEEEHPRAASAGTANDFLDAALAALCAEANELDEGQT
jgi:hypothetical protein